MHSWCKSVEGGERLPLRTLQPSALPFLCCKNHNIMHYSFSVGLTRLSRSAALDRTSKGFFHACRPGSSGRGVPSGRSPARVASSGRLAAAGTSPVRRAGSVRRPMPSPQRAARTRSALQVCCLSRYWLLKLGCGVTVWGFSRG